MSTALFAFAYLLGLASFFTPCAVGMVPAYLGMFLRQKEVRGASAARRILDSVGFGAATTLGFLAVFGLAGAVLLASSPAVRRAIGPNLPILALLVGAVLIFLGVATLRSWSLPWSLPVKAPRRRGVIGFVLFGAAYALVSFSCNLPLFLAVVFAALAAGGGIPAALALVAYALGKGTMMTIAALLVAVPKASIDVRQLVRLTPQIRQVSAAALIAGGGIMIVYTTYLLGLA